MMGEPVRIANGPGGVWSWRQQPATCLRRGVFRNVASMRGALDGAGVMWG